jgi:hypothetical protein
LDATVAKGFGFAGSVRKDKKLDNKQAPPYFRVIFYLVYIA